MSLLSHRTRIAVNFLVEDETGSVAECLEALAGLLGFLVAASRIIAAAVLFVADLLEAASFTAKVFVIGINSLAFGVGVKL